MRKEEVAAYLVTETTSEPATVRDVQVFDKNSLFYIRFDATLQDFNVKNRNGRIYMGDAMIPSLQADHIMELQRNGSWYGEAGHPMVEDVKRILTIDPKLISHRIVKHNVDRYKCTGTIETLDTFYGKQMTKNTLQGMNPAFSLRALAPLVKKPDGTSVVKTKAHVVCYDWVILPSHKVAYRDTSKPTEKIIKKVIEDGNVVTECAITPLTENSIKDFIAMESTNVKIISNVCEVALDSMQLSSDLRNIILKESNSTYIIPIEEKIKHDVNTYLRNL